MHIWNWFNDLYSFSKYPKWYWVFDSYIAGCFPIPEVSLILLYHFSVHIPIPLSLSLFKLTHFHIKWHYRCCKGHDWCYEHASCKGIDHYFTPYKWKCNGGSPYCGEWADDPDLLLAIDQKQTLLGRPEQRLMEDHVYADSIICVWQDIDVCIFSQVFDSRHLWQDFPASLTYDCPVPSLPICTAFKHSLLTSLLTDRKAARASVKT